MAGHHGGSEGGLFRSLQLDVVGNKANLRQNEDAPKPFAGAVTCLLGNGEVKLSDGGLPVNANGKQVRFLPVPDLGTVGRMSCSRRIKVDAGTSVPLRKV